MNDVRYVKALVVDEVCLQCYSIPCDGTENNRYLPLFSAPIEDSSMPIMLHISFEAVLVALKSY